MPIYAQGGLFQLDAQNSSYQFAADEHGALLVTAVQLERRGYGKLPHIPLRGFDPAALYRCRALDMACSGAAWMAEGVTPESPLCQYEAARLLFERIDDIR